MSVAVSYLAWTLAEMGRQVRCLIPPDSVRPFAHPLVEWAELRPEPGPDDLRADLIITTIAPTWRRVVLAAQRSGAIGRLMFWHHHGPIPPGYGCVLARVAPGAAAPGWARDVLLPPASWALYQGGEPTGQAVVVPGASRQKGGDVALAVARLMPDVPWYVLPGRASEQELAPWRALPHATVALQGLPPAAWLAHARAVLSPSRAETYGLAIAEAAARGVPVVASDLPGPRFALGDVARYFPVSAQPAEWATALAAALAQEPRRLRLPPYADVVVGALGAAGRSAAGLSAAPIAAQPAAPAVVRRPAAPVPALPAARRPASAPTASSPVHSWPLGSKLHIGCGPKHIRGWLNTDGKPGAPDGVVDLEHPEQLPVAHFGSIYACHVLEHCYPADTLRILLGLIRALQPEGLLLLAVPDLRRAVQWPDTGRGDPNNPIFGNLRRDCHEYDRHKQIFWRERLEQLLASAGGEEIREWSPDEHPEIAAVADWSSHDEISLNMCCRAPARPHLTAEPVDQPDDPQPRCHPDGVDVSVILGTVNRPAMVQECIDSVRTSLQGSGYTHEIVVAYGAEDDPSLSWLREQPDVLPICGGMDGAIPAFNRAYLAARRGRYVAQINDDVLVEGDALAVAIRRLDERPGLAVVVFASSLDGGKTRYVPRAEDGVVHPNQLVARREAIEDVIASGFGAFWGDEAARTHKTYGGDTILGMWLHRLGWHVERCDDVRCLDRCRTQEAKDALRKSNMVGYAEHRTEMAERYPRAEFSAPIVRADDGWPHVYVPERGQLPRRSPAAAGPPERVLHISLRRGDTPSHPSLEAALDSLGMYRCLRWSEIQQQRGPQAVRDETLQAIREHRPTLIWMQVQQHSVFSERALLAAMRAAAPPGCLIVSWTGDVRTDEGEPCQPWQVAQCQGIDLFLASNCSYPVDLKLRHQVPARTGYMLCAADEWQNRPRPDARPADWAGAGRAVLVGGDHLCYQRSTRLEILRAVHVALPGQLHIYGQGQWGDLPHSGPITREQRGYLHAVAGAIISHSLFTKLRRYTSGRLPDALLCGGAPVVCQAFDDWEGLGVRDGEHLLVWRDSADLVELLRDWLRPERAEDRRRMAAAARQHALQHLTWPAAIEGMMAIVRAERLRRACGGRR